MGMKVHELPELDVLSPEYASDPRGVLAEIRPGSPIVRSQRGLETIAYSECQAVYRESRLAVGQLELFKQGGIDGTRFEDVFSKNINNSEGDEHKRLRAIVAPSFTPKAVEHLRQQTRALIDTWLDEVADEQECPFMDVLADRLPSAVFCLLLGAPVEDAPRVGRLSYSMTKMFLGDPQYRDEILSAFEELEDYAGELLEWRRREPADDVLGALVEAERRGDASPTDSVTMVLIILTASTDTTAGQLGHIVSALARHSEQWAKLRAEPEPMTAKVLEVARYAPGVWATARTAREPFEFCGVEVEAGDQIWSNVIGGNFDPGAFDDPLRLDLEVKRKNPPLNWGLGVHFCLGRFLAALELEEALRSMTQRWTEFELAFEPQLEGIPTLVAPRGVTLRFETNVGTHAPPPGR